MIVPLNNDAKSVNTAMLRIAQMNNKDIDYMSAQIADMKVRQSEMEARADTQKKRWKNYRASFDAIMVQFRVHQGAITSDELSQLLPGYTG